MCTSVLARASPTMLCIRTSYCSGDLFQTIIMDEATKKIHFGSWEQVKIGGQSPCARYSQATALFEDTIYLFGGASSSDDGNTVYHQDFFALNLTRSPLEWLTIDHKGAIPSAREGASLNAVDNKLYLFGGIESESAKICAEGLFVFTPDSRSWAKMPTKGPVPTAQSSSSVVYKQKLLTFGGIINGKAHNALHSLNFSTLEWTEEKTSGTKPPPRCDHLTAVVGDKMLLSCGSGRDDLWFNDIHTLDLTTWQWSRLEPKGGVAPSPRDYATANVIANKYIVQFGGFSGTSGDEECFADVHYVDFSSDFEWHPVSVSGDRLPARYAHSAISYKEKLYVLGGQNTEEEFGDVWALPIQVPATAVPFEPVPMPRVRYSTSTPIPAPRKVVTPAPPAPLKPRDLDELRTKYVKNVNEIFDTLTERFQQLDMATATLEAERAAFESEKKAHNELYEKQQQELDEMLKHHKQENEEWVSHMHSKLTSERQTLAEEKAAAEEASADFAKQQEIFQQKSKKLDAIMRQVQGLTD